MWCGQVSEREFASESAFASEEPNWKEIICSFDVKKLIELLDSDDPCYAKYNAD